MAKIKVQSNGYKITISAKLQLSEAIKISDIVAISNDNTLPFIKFDVFKPKSIIFQSVTGIVLNDYLKRKIKKRDFLILIEKTLVAIRAIEKMKLDFSGLILDKKYIFINSNTNCLYFIYLPTNIAKRQNNILSFLYEISNNIVPDLENDMNYVSRFRKFLSESDAPSIDKIENFIILEDRTIVNDVRKAETINNDSFQVCASVQNGNTQLIADYVNKTVISDDDTQLTKLTKDLWKLQSNKTFDNFDLTDISVNNEDSDETEIDNDSTDIINNYGYGQKAAIENQTNNSYPVLLRILTNERVIIDKPVFRLGKEKRYVD